MSAVLAAIVIFLVLGASMGLLYTYLEQVDEYNRHVSKVNEKQRYAVHENIVMSATSTSDRTFDINIKNSSSDPVQIIEVRSMTLQGIITPIEGLNDMTLESFAHDTLSYTIPEHISDNVSILAITSAGNTFSVELDSNDIVTSSVVNEGSATINGMGLSSRLAQLEYAGHAIYGSDSWGAEESLKPYITMDDNEALTPPQFASIVLDSDMENTFQINEYRHDEIITVNSDGTVNSIPKPNVLTYTQSRGDASVSYDSNGITVSGTGPALLKIDPGLFGKTLFLDASVGNGRIEILTSPYGTLAENITTQQIKNRCDGVSWTHNFTDYRTRYIQHSSTLVGSLNWKFDPTKFDAFVIHEQFVPPPLSTIKAISTYAKPLSSDERFTHYVYWALNHSSLRYSDTGVSMSSHYATSNDHSYGSSRTPHSYFDRYNNHPGDYVITYDTTTVTLPDQGILLRNNERFHVSYAPMMELTMDISQQSSELAHAPHYINDVTSITAQSNYYNIIIDGKYYAHNPSHYPPYITAHSNLEPQFQITNPPVRIYYVDQHFWGIPVMSFRSGNIGNDDYVNLTEITFNAIDTNPTNTYANSRLNKLYYPDSTADITDGNNLCIMSKDPYKIENTIDSDMQAHKIILPDRVDPYAKHLYIMVYPNNSQVSFKAVAADSIMGIDPNTPFRIVGKTNTLHTGISSSDGSIEFIDELPDSFSLRTYPESMLYRGSFSTIVFDPHSKQSIRIPTPDDRIYTVHTWAQIPVVGNVDVSNVEVRTKSGTVLQLEYLDGMYSASQDDLGRIWVPVIPGYFSIHMKINEVDAVLRYADVLGKNNVKVIAPSTNTVSKESFTAPITKIRASAGATAYSIATSDGEMAAIIHGTVSGTAYIDHAYNSSRKLIPCARDPLTGWIQVYKNGVLFGSDSKFIDYEPQISTNNYVDSDGLRHVKTIFEYDNWPISKTIAIPVQTGDFVEFHIHSNIFAESPLTTPITLPPVGRCGWTSIFTHASSHASATANIHDGSIIIG